MPKSETKLFRNWNGNSIAQTDRDQKRFAQTQKMVEKLLDWR